MNYETKATSLIAEFIKNEGVNYRELSSLLANIDVEESQTNLSNKINRGTFSFAFVLQLADVLNAEVQFVKATPAISGKELFIEQMAKINNLTRCNESNELYKILTEATRQLFNKVGFDGAIVEFYGDCDWGEMNLAIEPELLERLYEELHAENSAIMQARQIQNDIRLAKI